MPLKWRSKLRFDAPSERSLAGAKYLPFDGIA